MPSFANNIVTLFLSKPATELLSLQAGQIILDLLFAQGPEPWTLRTVNAFIA